MVSKSYRAVKQVKALLHVNDSVDPSDSTAHWCLAGLSVQQKLGSGAERRVGIGARHSDHLDLARTHLVSAQPRRGLRRFVKDVTSLTFFKVVAIDGFARLGACTASFFSQAEALVRDHSTSFVLHRKSFTR